MPEKIIPAIPPTASIQPIPRSQYILIDGKHVARLLTATIRGKEETRHFNVFLRGDKKATQMTAEQIVAFLAEQSAGKDGNAAR